MRSSTAFVLSLALLGAACGSPEQRPASASGAAGVGGTAETPTAGSGGSPGAGGAIQAGNAGGGAGGAGGANQAGSGGVFGDCSAQLPDSLFCKPLGPMPKSIKATDCFPPHPT